MDLYGNTFHVASVECDFEFAEVIEQEKDELWRRLLNVYFKDEPTLYDLLNDEEKWEDYFAELTSDEDAKEMFEDHFHRQLTHRYAGTLHGKTTTKPDMIVRQIALFVGTYYVAHYIKSNEIYLSAEHKLKCANTMLKIEIRSLGKDLERRDDLCDDLLNEIYRHERKIEISAADNDELILKNKSRRAKINMLKEELRKLTGGAKGSGKKQETTSLSKTVSEKSEKTSEKSSKGKKKEKAKQESCSSDSSESEEK